MICFYEDIEHKAISKEAHNGDHRVQGGIHLITEVINSVMACVITGRRYCQISGFVHVSLGIFSWSLFVALKYPSKMFLMMVNASYAVISEEAQTANFHVV